MNLKEACQEKCYAIYNKKNLTKTDGNILSTYFETTSKGGNIMLVAVLALIIIFADMYLTRSNTYTTFSDLSDYDYDYR